MLSSHKYILFYLLLLMSYIVHANTIDDTFDISLPRTLYEHSHYSMQINIHPNVFFLTAKLFINSADSNIVNLNVHNCDFVRHINKTCKVDFDTVNSGDTSFMINGLSYGTKLIPVSVIGDIDYGKLNVNILNTYLTVGEYMTMQVSIENSRSIEHAITFNFQSSNPAIVNFAPTSCQLNSNDSMCYVRIYALQSGITNVTVTGNHYDKQSRQITIHSFGHLQLSLDNDRVFVNSPFVVKAVISNSAYREKLVAVTFKYDSKHITANSNYCNIMPNETSCRIKLYSKSFAGATHISATSTGYQDTAIDFNIMNPGFIRANLNHYHIHKGDDGLITIVLVNSAFLDSPIHILISTTSNDIISFNTNSCDLTQQDNSCVVKVIGLNRGYANIKISANSHYNTVNLDTEVLLPEKLGTLVVKPLSIKSLSTDKTHLIITLNNSQYIYDPFPVNIMTYGSAQVIIQPAVCYISSYNNSCNVLITADHPGNTNLIIQADNYPTVSIPVIVNAKPGVIGFDSKSVNVDGVNTEDSFKLVLRNSKYMHTCTKFMLLVDNVDVAKLNKYSCCLDSDHNTCSILAVGKQIGSTTVKVSGRNYNSDAVPLVVAHLGKLLLQLNNTQLVIGKSLKASIAIADSTDINSLIPVSIVSNNDNVIFDKTECLLSTLDNTCTVNILAHKTGKSSIKVFANGYGIQTQVVQVVDKMWVWQNGFKYPVSAAHYGVKNIFGHDNTPGGRYDAVSWVDSNGYFWMFGGMGTGNSEINGLLNDLWKYDPQRKMWAWVGGDIEVNNSANYISPNVNPGGRFGANSWLTHDGRLFIFGGSGMLNDQNGLMNDIWLFDSKTKTWSWVDGDKKINSCGNYTEHDLLTPSARSDSIVWVDSNDNLWMFGGNGIISCDGSTKTKTGYLNDLWMYSLKQHRWNLIRGILEGNNFGHYGTRLIPDKANTPGSRSRAVSWVDDNDNLWLFGGIGYGNPDFNASGMLNDIWEYNIKYNTWVWVNGNSTIDHLGNYSYDEHAFIGARSMSALWNVGHNKVVIFGGKGYTDTDHFEGLLNDLWQYNYKTNKWVLLKGNSDVDDLAVYSNKGVADIKNMPAANIGVIPWFDSQQHTLFLFGGYSDSSTNEYFGETWSFQYE